MDDEELKPGPGPLMWGAVGYCLGIVFCFLLWLFHAATQHPEYVPDSWDDKRYVRVYHDHHYPNLANCRGGYEVYPDGDWVCFKTPRR